MNILRELFKSVTKKHVFLNLKLNHIIFEFKVFFNAKTDMNL
jgi:hypothetical protein